MNLVSLEIPTSIKIDSKKIRELLEIKVISKESYIYFALKITQENTKNKNVEINIDNFCEEWNLKPFETKKAIQSLENKGALNTNLPEIIQLSLF